MTTEPPWRDFAARLADRIAAIGAVDDPAWLAAVRGVPRHELVRRFYERNLAGRWIETDGSRPSQRASWLDTVYSDVPLVTALREDFVDPAISTSVRPRILAQMLETLDVRDGDRVLEIGTGPGYGTALLCHRLGDRNVFSVDIERDLIDLARARLAAIGYAPTLAFDDGWLGLDDHAPYDRIFATCSVPSIPWQWARQLQPGGVLLADLKVAADAGNLVRLTRVTDDRLEGVFDATAAGFVPLRDRAGHPNEPVDTHPGAATSDQIKRTSILGPRTPWDEPLVWFLAALDFGDYGPHVRRRVVGPSDCDPPTQIKFSMPDGSYAEIDIHAYEGRYGVIEGGPRRIWESVERANQLWHDLGEPRWGAFRLTVTPETHTLSLHGPEGEHRWTRRTATTLLAPASWTKHAAQPTPRNRHARPTMPPASPAPTHQEDDR